VPAFVEVNEVAGTFPAGNGLLKNVGVPVLIGRFRLRRFYIQQSAELAQEEVRIATLGATAHLPLGDEGLQLRSVVGCHAAKVGNCGLLEMDRSEGSDRWGVEKPMAGIRDTRALAMARARSVTPALQPGSQASGFLVQCSEVGECVLRTGRVRYRVFARHDSQNRRKQAMHHSAHKSQEFRRH
jgi:hypothetical protein